MHSRANQPRLSVVVWCDLDGALVATMPRAANGRGTLVPFLECRIGEAQFLGALRPGALDFLRAVRAVAAVRLLTFAHRDYAEEINCQFGLGFGAAEITAQLDWYGGFLRPEPLRRVSPPLTVTDVLVSHPSDGMNNAKLAWLGPTARLVLVPDFDGCSDDGFGEEWQRYAADVVRVLTGGSSTGGVTK